MKWMLLDRPTLSLNWNTISVSREALPMASGQLQLRSTTKTKINGRNWLWCTIHEVVSQWPKLMNQSMRWATQRPWKDMIPGKIAGQWYVRWEPKKEKLRKLKYVNPFSVSGRIIRRQWTHHERRQYRWGSLRYHEKWRIWTNRSPRKARVLVCSFGKINKRIDVSRTSYLVPKFDLREGREHHISAIISKSCQNEGFQY